MFHKTGGKLCLVPKNLVSSEVYNVIMSRVNEECHVTHPCVIISLLCCALSLVRGVAESEYERSFIVLPHLLEDLRGEGSRARRGSYQNIGLHFLHQLQKRLGGTMLLGIVDFVSFQMT